MRLGSRCGPPRTLAVLVLALLAAPALAQPVPPAAQHPAARAAPHPASQHTAARRAVAHPAPHPAPSPPPPPADPAPPEPPPPDKGSATGLPLPRFASLRTDDVNFRAGPGTRYPIEWVYKRRDLPVEIEREFDVWRLVRDPDNNRGWVHTATLASRRTLIVTGKGGQVLRAAARDDAAPVANLDPGVIGRLRACAPASDWCQVQVQDYKGWMKRDAFWGILSGEAVQ
jgi:SH3-like domain-containing protein